MAAFNFETQMILYIGHVCIIFVTLILQGNMGQGKRAVDKQGRDGKGKILTILTNGIIVGSGFQQKYAKNIWIKGNNRPRKGPDFPTKYCVQMHYLIKYKSNFLFCFFNFRNYTGAGNRNLTYTAD